MSEALDYLKKEEWSMGNGQCPKCCGVHAGWHGHPCYMTTEKIGHKPDCPLAGAIKSAGGSPLMQGDFKSEVEYEHFISETGLYGTRPKTPEGCPRYAAEMARFRAVYDDLLARELFKDT
jgi:hypothetical protein